ncbi:uncharacterized protein K460DRAFT_400712 [Cucurbitaria berberidis CBS 394.84]|uniref:Uncharacterized protein n=1 Tax=Cucurbitaria berberidis CBS 394.84 TaxID=1168544 RepID=A0A9P4GSH7_9PLEO|nr:uncharacterized protein K460DRAFT_400712 [Cucurbitaria berberidis CBS 394.84]KAF1850666.1 hypothetical protein K460DRAFT_400712 [Cucurbitaria berberidis CBS 394.84]
MSAPEYFDYAYTYGTTPSSAFGAPKATEKNSNATYLEPTMSFQAQFINVPEHGGLPPSQGNGSARKLTFAQILAIPALDSTDPKPPKYLDCTGTNRIQDMPPPQPNHVTDTDMIVSLIHSGVLEHEGYMWADVTELQNWLFGELTKRLNHLFDLEDRRLPAEFAAPPLIREVRGVPKNTTPLAKWCRTGRQRSINFRNFPGIVYRLESFDFEYEISIHDLMELIEEATNRLDTPLNAGSTASAPTASSQRVHQSIAAYSGMFNGNMEMVGESMLDNQPPMFSQSVFAPLANELPRNYQPGQRIRTPMSTEGSQIAQRRKAPMKNLAALHNSTNGARNLDLGGNFHRKHSGGCTSERRDQS